MKTKIIKIGELKILVEEKPKHAIYLVGSNGGLSLITGPITDASISDASLVELERQLPRPQGSRLVPVR